MCNLTFYWFPIINIFDVGIYCVFDSKLLLFYVFQYFIPFGVISFVYIQMAVRLWGSKTPGNAQDTRDITLMRNKKRVCIPITIAHSTFNTTQKTRNQN